MIEVIIMAWQINVMADKKASPYYREFICDKVADIENLPSNQGLGNIRAGDDLSKLCSTGSIAIVLETSDVYMINTEGEWVCL